MMPVRFRSWKLEAVRMRPGMYVDLPQRRSSSSGLEIVDNSIDEALAGLLAILKFSLKRIIRSRLSMMVVGSQWISKKDGSTCRWNCVLPCFAGGKFGGGGYRVSENWSSRGRVISCEYPLHIPRCSRLLKMAVSVPRVSTWTCCGWFGSPSRPDPDRDNRPLYSRPRNLHRKYDDFEKLNNSSELALRIVASAFPWQMTRRPGQKSITTAKVGSLVTSNTSMKTKMSSLKNNLRWLKMDDITVEVAMQYTTGFSWDGHGLRITFIPMKIGTRTELRTALTRVFNDYAKKNKLLKKTKTI